MPTWIGTVARDLHAPVLSLYLTAVIAALHYSLSSACTDPLRANGGDPLDDWWRPWTYGLAHADDDHLWGNLSGLLMYGAWFEAVHGTPALGALVATTLPAASLAHALASDRYLRGFSGVVFGLLTCPVVSLAMNWSEMQMRWVRLAVYLPLVLLIVIDQVYASDKICVEGHAAGAAAGALVAVVLGRNFVEQPWELGAAWAAVAMLLAYAVVAVSVDPETWVYGLGVALPTLLALAPRAAIRTWDHLHPSSPDTPLPQHQEPAVFPLSWIL